MKHLTKYKWDALILLGAFLAFMLVSMFGGCTIGTTNKVTVNQYGDSDSSKTNISNITIQKDTIKNPKK